MERRHEFKVKHADNLLGVETIFEPRLWLSTNRARREKKGREEKSCRKNTKTEMKQSDYRSKPSGVKSGCEFKASSW